MLAALLVAFLGFMVFVGPGGDQFGELMTRHIEDQIEITLAEEDRCQAALQNLSVLNDDIGDMNQQLSKDVKALEKLIKDYDSKPTGFDRLFASVLAKREQQIDKIWDGRQAMLQHIQTDEWRANIGGVRAEMEKAAAKKK
jgi:hypothetical protein